MKKQFFIWILLIFLHPVSVYASDTGSLDEFYDEAELSETADLVAEETGMDFKELILQIYDQDTSLSASLYSQAKTVLTESVSANKEALKQVILLAVLGALISSMSGAFPNRQVGNAGFYICYLCAAGFLMAAFVQASQIADNLLELLLEFMQSIVPAYYLGAVITLGESTGFYGVFLIVLALVEKLMRGLLMPGIQLYLVLMLLNYLQNEDNLSKLAELIKTILDWCMKTIFATVIGLQLVQSLIVPYAAGVKNNLIYKAATAIPGIGGSIGAVSGVVIGSSMLIRNAVGVAVILIILLLCLTPIIQMGVISLMYQAGGAVIQPFADKRMVGAMSAASNAVKMLLKLVLISALMFLITIAVLCSTRSVYS